MWNLIHSKNILHIGFCALAKIWEQINFSLLIENTYEAAASTSDTFHSLAYTEGCVS